MAISYADSRTLGATEGLTPSRTKHQIPFDNAQGRLSPRLPHEHSLLRRAPGARVLRMTLC